MFYYRMLAAKFMFVDTFINSSYSLSKLQWAPDFVKNLLERL